jgi:hypothetical protein
MSKTVKYIRSNKHKSGCCLIAFAIFLAYFGTSLSRIINYEFPEKGRNVNCPDCIYVAHEIAPNYRVIYYDSKLAASTLQSINMICIILTLFGSVLILCHSAENAQRSSL